MSFLVDLGILIFLFSVGGGIYNYLTSKGSSLSGHSDNKGVEE